jgi:hypothetical protein
MRHIPSDDAEKIRETVVRAAVSAADPSRRSRPLYLTKKVNDAPTSRGRPIVPVCSFSDGM